MWKQGVNFEIYGICLMSLKIPAISARFLLQKTHIQFVIL